MPALRGEGMAERALKRYLEMKDLEGWKEYKELKERKVKRKEAL